jgi:hypothetical protein
MDGGQVDDCQHETILLVDVDIGAAADCKHEVKITTIGRQRSFETEV